MNYKVKLLKILEILMTTDEEHPLTAAQIGEKLKLYGIEAERKSIYRDINILRDDANYDIILSNDNKQGFYMASREFEDWEIKILIDAVWSSKFLTDNNSKLLTKKLSSLVSENSQKILHRSSPIKSKIKSSNVTTKLSIENILTAIKKNKQISFQYTYTNPNKEKYFNRDGFVYTLNPYALIWQNEHYYLIGNYYKYEDLSYYRLDRIKNLEVKNEKRKDLTEILGNNADIKLEEYVRNAIYNYSGEKIKLTLQVEDFMVDDIIDKFGSEIHFTPSGDKYEVIVDVMDSNGLYYWLLQYESNVKVISPEYVKNKLLEKVNGILNLYKNDNS